MPVETRATRTFSFRYQLCTSAFKGRSWCSVCWKQPGWANFGSPCCSCSQDGQCLPHWWPLTASSALGLPALQLGRQFQRGRKKRESSKTSLSPSQPVSVQGSPLIRGWVFGGHVPASIIPERHDKAFEIHRGELYVESPCKSFKKKKRQLY